MDKHVPKLEYCQRLKELGYPQDSQFYWYNSMASGGKWIVCEGKGFSRPIEEYMDGNVIAAPLVSEMMTSIPDNFSCGKDGDGKYGCSNNREFFGGETLADACAACLTALAKKGLIKLNA